MAVIDSSFQMTYDQFECFSRVLKVDTLSDVKEMELCNYSDHVGLLSVLLVLNNQLLVEKSGLS